MVKIIAPTLFTFISITNSLSQTKLSGNWIVLGSKVDSVINDPTYNKKFRGYFFKNNEAFINYSIYERGAPIALRVIGENEISLNHEVFNIEFNNERIILTNSFGYKITLVKENSFLSNEATVSKNNFIPPKIQIDISLYDYFFSISKSVEVTNNTLNVKEGLRALSESIGSLENDVSVKLFFQVRKDGTISNFKIIETTIPKKSEHIKAKIFATSGNWIPAKENELNVDSNVELIFERQGTKTIAQLVKAANNFTTGKAKFDREKFDKAIFYFTKSIELDPKNSKYYYYRAQAYINLKNTEKACGDLKMILEKNDSVEKLKKENCLD